MHIPSSQSQDVALLDFEEALSRSGRSGGYDAEKWLYVPDFYTEYRYILGTRGQNPLICIGVNPSTAAPEDLDNTLKSVSRIAAGNGFDSWVMFNVYAQRATRPDDMDRQRNEALHRENMRAFAWLRLGCGDRKAGLSPRLCAGHGGPGAAVRRPLALRRRLLQEGTSPPSAVSAQGRKGPGL